LREVAWNLPVAVIILEGRSHIIDETASAKLAARIRASYRSEYRCGLRMIEGVGSVFFNCDRTV
jgi:hypothetical protein